MRALHVGFDKIIEDRFIGFYNKCKINNKKDINHVLVSFVWVFDNSFDGGSDFERCFELHENNIFSCSEYISNLFENEFGLHPFKTVRYAYNILRNAIGDEEYSRLIKRLGLNCNE